MKDIPVQCCRCRNKHMESQRVSKPSKLMGAHSSINVTDSCCPKCNARSFYDLTPQVAWCWASGLIEIGDNVPEGAIEIAVGPKCSLKSILDVKARHGMGASAGKLLVPGVPEAEDQKGAADALAAWLAWCGKSKSLNGVVFAQEVGS